jgi:hypothetical protein
MGAHYVIPNQLLSPVPTASHAYSLASQIVREAWRTLAGCTNDHEQLKSYW